MGRFLAFTRVQENSADQAGAQYLSRAGISGRGSLAFFERLQNLEFRMNIPQEDSYARTHPLNRERIAVLETRYRADPAWDAPTDPALEARFQRVRAKLAGYVDDPRRVLIRYPESDHSIPARYARAYAYHRTAHPEQAMAEVDALVAISPHDPYFLELRGQVLLESGRAAEAVTVLREAVARAPDQPLIAALFGHALISTENPANFEEAKRVLRLAVARDNDNPFAWYQLGIVYDREGDEARAALATAERYNLMGQPQLALPNAERAMMGIPPNSPDWLRAQDIAMVSRSAMQRQRRNR
jgi:predicted Zn-dependent protease